VDAFYCFQDGTALRAQAMPVDRSHPGSKPFLTPFVFPSGKTCGDFDQFALACVQNWPVAVDLLREGSFTSFFRSLGRADVALAAEEAKRFPDPDRGLDLFLAALPARSLPSPLLDVEPRKLDLGVCRVGANWQGDLKLVNRGQGLLYGSVSCEDCDWLSVGKAPGAAQKIFQFVQSAVVPLRVRGQRLRAGPRPLTGRVVIQSNGGTQVVIVSAQVPVTPFPAGILGGACSPRQVAEKARANPGVAATLFENGAVAAWYNSNGWPYPIQGRQTPGPVALRQFLAALGLPTTPRVELSANVLVLTCISGQGVQHTLQVSTSENCPLSAQAVSDSPWLRVAEIRLAGRVATIHLSVAAIPDAPGAVRRARLTVTANGNQRFEVPVVLKVVAPSSVASRFPPLGEAPPLLPVPPPAEVPRAAVKPPVAKLVAPVAKLVVGPVSAVPWRLFR
jgi:hypothetical protein